MAYFFLSGKLLQEDSFLNFVSRIYKDFLSRNEAEYETYVAAGNSLTLDRKAWISRCKDEKTLREEEGTLQSFRSFALSRLRTLISMDMEERIAFLEHDRALDGDVRTALALVEEGAVLAAARAVAP